MKPAATTSAPSLFGGPKPTGSLFGNTQPAQSQPASSLFGQSTSQPSGSLFGSNAQSQPATNSLFGGQNQPQQQQQQQPATGGGLFGNTAPSQQSSTGGGLFGNTTQSQQPSTGGGLFGNTTQTQQPSSSLFGSTTQQPSTGLFGSTTTQQQSGSGSLFGSSLFGNTNTSQQQQNQGDSSLFGSTNQQQQGGGLFGGSTTGTNPLQAQSTLPAGGFGTGTGSSLFGNQQRTQPVHQAGAPPFTKNTRFNDLPDQLKKTFEDIENHIQGRIQIGKGLKQRDLGEDAVKGQEQLRKAQKDLVGVLSTTHTDALQTRDLKAKVDQAVQDMIITTRILEGFRNPQQHGAYLRDHAGFPLEFFQRITEQMKDRLQWYKSTIEQIERKLASASSQAQYTPQAISATLETQHATFMALASKTADLHAELQKIKAIYTQLWRAKTGSMRDPFDGSGPGLEM